MGAIHVSCNCSAFLSAVFLCSRLMSLSENAQTLVDILGDLFTIIFLFSYVLRYLLVSPAIWSLAPISNATVSHATSRLETES